MADEFVSAISLTFDESAIPTLKAQAQVYAESIQNSPEGYKLCLTKFHQISTAAATAAATAIAALSSSSSSSSPSSSLLFSTAFSAASSVAPPQVLFFCLQTLQFTLIHHYDSDMNESERTFIRTSLMVYMRDVLPLLQQHFYPPPLYIRTKLASCIVEIIKADYPARWPTLFDDLLVLVSRSHEVDSLVDLFLRICSSINEDIVLVVREKGALIGSRLSEEEELNSTSSSVSSTSNRVTIGNERNQLARFGGIKDAMREKAIPSLVEAMYQLANGYVNSKPYIANLTLEAVREYIDWIEISLIANERWIGLFYQLLSRPPPLSISSILCLQHIIGKRMEYKKKLILITQINIIEVIGQLNIVEMNEELAIAVAELVEAIGEEIIECWREEQKAGATGGERTTIANTNGNSIHLNGHPTTNGLLPSSSSSSSVASSSSSSSSSLPSSSIPNASDLLEKIMHLCYRLLEHPNYKVSEAVFSLPLEFSHLLKRSSSSSVQLLHTKKLFVTIERNLHYPSFYNWNEPDDEELQFQEYRERCLIKLLSTLCAAQAEAVLELVGSNLLRVLQQWKTLEFEAIEAGLKLFYVIGESLSHTGKSVNMAMRVGIEPFPTLLRSLLSSDISQYTHPQVTLLYHDIIVRYHPFLSSFPEFVPPVLASLLDHRGLLHSHPTVRARSCYHLLKLLSGLSEAVKKQLAPFVEQMLKQIEKVMQIYILEVEKGIVGVGGGVEGVVSGKGKNETVPTIDSDSFNYLCEVMGLLCSSPISGEKCRDYFTALYSVFKSHLDSSISSSSSWLNDGAAIERMCIRCTMLIDAMGNMSKGVAKDAGRLQAVLGGAFQSVLQVLQVLAPHSSSLRNRIVFFTHRMIECLRENILPFIPSAIESLLTHSQSTDNITELITLVNQLLTKFTRSFEVDRFFLPLCRKVFEGLAAFNHLDEVKLPSSSSSSASSSSTTGTAAGYSSEKQERLSLQRHYFLFLRSIVTSDSLSVLTSPTNIPHIKSILDTITRSCASPTDAAIQKNCLVVLRGLLKWWGRREMRGSQDEAAMRSWLQREVTTAMYAGVMQPNWSLSDGLWLSAFREWCDLQYDLIVAYESEYVQLLGEFLMKGQWKWGEENVKEYMRLFQEAANLKRSQTGKTAAQMAQEGMGWENNIKIFIGRMKGGNESVGGKGGKKGGKGGNAVLGNHGQLNGR